MTVQELIDKLIYECGKEDPKNVPIVLEHYVHGESWPEVSKPFVDSFIDKNKQFVVAIKS